MSLATRCTTCGTVFRVVQDQLKVSEGWVRCGRCEEVFNALEGLFDLEREAPPPWPPMPAAPAAPDAWPAPGTIRASDPYADTADLGRQPLLHAEAEDSAPPGDFAHARFNTDLLDEDEVARLEADERAARGEVPASHDTVGDTVADTVADTVVDSRVDEERAAPASAEAAVVAPAMPNAQALARSPTLVDEPPPRFLRQAERAARWRRPQVRAALVVAGLLAAAGLSAQAALHWRDTVAAQWPQARPLVEALCDATGCRVEPPRRLDALAVEASGLVRLEAANLYRFSVALHNRAPHPVRLPSVDLTLTDAQGQVVARRMFAPAELGAADATAAAGADVALQGLLDAGERRLAGYQVEIFYP